jgi:hypothetical protein
MMEGEVMEGEVRKGAVREGGQGGRGQGGRGQGAGPVREGEGRGPTLLPVLRPDPGSRFRARLPALIGPGAADAVAGVAFFSDTDVVDFGRFDRAFVGLFEILSGESWLAMLDEVLRPFLCSLSLARSLALAPPLSDSHLSHLSHLPPFRHSTYSFIYISGT